MELLVETAKFQDLSFIYNVYFQAFGQSPLQNVSLSKERQVGRLSVIKAIFLHLFHIVVERMFISIQTARVAALIDHNVDMIPLKIVYENQIIGFCFLKKHNPKVFEVGIIALKKNKRELGLGFQTIEIIKRRVKAEGAGRLIVRASGVRQVAGFFTKCGFKQAFSEEILFCDVK